LGCGSSDTAPAKQGQGPEFKPQYKTTSQIIKKKKKTEQAKTKTGLRYNIFF
jgi:hypothetical protein